MLTFPFQLHDSLFNLCPAASQCAALAALLSFSFSLV